MKKVFYFPFVFLYFFVASNIFTSCAESSDTKDADTTEDSSSTPDTKEPDSLIASLDQAKIIFIDGGDADTHELFLQDNKGRCAQIKKATPGSIHWVIKRDLDIVITKITTKEIENNPTIFNTDPEEISRRVWFGDIKEGTEGYRYWYNIEWKDKDSVVHLYDPLIQINPL
ncbi:hypothetical protein BH20BAC1_BH20BAC1_05470 [soil metagenome]